MNTFLDLVRRRRSISWRFIIVEGERKDRLVEEALGGIVVPNRWAKTAPVIAVIAMDLDAVIHGIAGAVKKIRYHMIDAGIAGEHFVLQATELGLGTCWIGWFDKRAVKRILGLRAGWDVPALIAVGFPDQEPGEKSRRAVSEIVIRNTPNESEKR